MSEEQHERLVERMIDRIDSRFMRGEMTQAEYDAEIRAVDRRAAAMLRSVGV